MYNNYGLRIQNKLNAAKQVSRTKMYDMKSNLFINDIEVSICKFCGKWIL